MLLDAGKASLLLIDMQERLLPAMDGAGKIEERAKILVEAAKALGVPIAASEQYPKGLGHTVGSLKAALGNAPVFEKTAFSCWRDDALKAHLIGHHERGRPQVIVAGVEAHVCVLQTAVDLAAAGFGVFAVADAMSSRVPTSSALAEERMRQAGVFVINSEMAVFELLGRAGTEDFRKVSQLIR